MQRAKHPRMNGKVRVSPKGWRTFFDFPNAKILRFLKQENKMLNIIAHF